MITVAMSTVIAAEHRRVWRALTDPSELVSWDERILAAVEPPTQYPFSGQHMRWRYKLGSVQLVMHDRPLEVRPFEKLHTSISVGSMRYEQIFLLQSEPGDPPRTRLSMKVHASNSVPVIGEIVDRFEVRKMASEHIDVTLAALQAWCEGGAAKATTNAAAEGMRAAPRARAAKERKRRRKASDAIPAKPPEH